MDLDDLLAKYADKLEQASSVGSRWDVPPYACIIPIFLLL